MIKIIVATYKEFIVAVYSNFQSVPEWNYTGCICTLYSHVEAAGG